MERTRYLVVGAGVTGLAFANFVRSRDLVLLERDEQIGGYCKTVLRDGFVWDYSGHFFHFRHPEIERWLVERMPPGEVRTVVKRAKILYGETLVDFPFQKNIHQLPREDFLDCLYHLFFREAGEETTFKQMAYRRFGRGIAERFLIPYNEKLYACDLDDLDADAMGRFFPHADLADIVRHFREPVDRSYNATFTYPRGGAVQYVRALARDLPPGAIRLRQPLLGIDLDRKVARTPAGDIAFEHLVSSAPLKDLLSLAGVEHDPAVFRWSKVLVFNLGFDRKGWEGVHWVYFPGREYLFYRVGFYDNIFDSDRMSLYVEIGYAAEAPVDVAAARRRVLSDLERAGIVTGHRLVAEHHAVLDPAYVHIRRDSQEAVSRYRAALAGRGVHSVGRYGAWTYCSIEDNIVEARALAERLAGG